MIHRILTNAFTKHDIPRTVATNIRVAKPNLYMQLSSSLKRHQYITTGRIELNSTPSKPVQRPIASVIELIPILPSIGTRTTASLICTGCRGNLLSRI